MIEASVRARIPIKMRGDVAAEFVTFHGLADAQEHLAIVFPHTDEIPLVRIHSECLTGDLFHSERCDCGRQLDETKLLLAARGGVLLYLRQEGRGIGLYSKLDAYKLQTEKGYDTYQANAALNLPEDARTYDVAAAMLKAMGITEVRLITNNPLKTKGLREAGIAIHSVVPTSTYVTPENRTYLCAKVEKTGHTLKLG